MIKEYRNLAWFYRVEQYRRKGGGEGYDFIHKYIQICISIYNYYSTHKCVYHCKLEMCA